MDAIVFFIAAMAISTVVLSYSVPSSGQVDSLDGDLNAGEILDVFLRASVCERLTLQVGRPILVDGHEDVAACLALEISALDAGIAESAFAGLNSILERTLISVCSQAFDPHLVVLVLTDSGWTTLLVLHGMPDPTHEASASSAELTTDDETPCLVELVLCPAAPPEDVDV